MSICACLISIHALREEGDKMYRDSYNLHIMISIHALREEGDGRITEDNVPAKLFLSTPSARRATTDGEHCAPSSKISIHALREEGDSKNRDKISIFKQIIQHSARI